MAQYTSDVMHAFGPNGELSRGAEIALDRFRLTIGNDGGGGGGTTVTDDVVAAYIGAPSSKTRDALNSILGTYLTQNQGDARYLKQGEGLTTAALEPYLTTDSAEATYAKKGETTPGGGTLDTEWVFLSNYCVGDGSNETAKVQEAVNACLTSGATLVCDVEGVIGLGSRVTFGDTRGNSRGQFIFMAIGFLRLKALASMREMIYHTGAISLLGLKIEFDGASLVNFGLYGHNAGRSEIGSLNGWNLLTSLAVVEPGEAAGQPNNNNNVMHYDSIRGTSIGTKWTGSATLTAVSDTGTGAGWRSSGDSAFYSTWTLSSALPDALTVTPWAAVWVQFSDGRFMKIRRIVNATTIEVTSEQRAVGTTDTLTIVPPVANWPYDGDMGEFTVRRFDVISCPNAHTLNYGGYGMTIQSLVQQYLYWGVGIGKWAVGFSVMYMYTENLLGKVGSVEAPWLVSHIGASTQLFVGPGVNTHVGEFQVIDATGVNDSTSWMSMTKRNTQPVNWYISRASGSPIVQPPAPLPAPVDPPELTPGTRNVTPGTVQAYRRTSGNYTLRIQNATNTTGVGIIKLMAPVGGASAAVFSLATTAGSHTIEGGSTYTVPIPGEVTLVYWLEGTTWRVRPTGAPLDTITSISAAPSRVGQISVVSGVIYMAAGTTAASDWKQIS